MTDLKASSLRALKLMDLTTLNDDDTNEKVIALCHQAKTPVGNTAAVCIYPRFFFQLTGFDDHFQQHVSRRTGFLTGFHQLETDLLVAGDQRAVREDHVHFVSAVSDRRAGFRQRNVDIVIPVREVGDRGGLHLPALHPDRP